MLTQAIVTLPQSAPAQSAQSQAKGTDAQAVQNRPASQNKRDGQAADTFGAMLTRQLDEKNQPAPDDSAAAPNLMPARKTADGKDLHAEEQTVPSSDSATLAFTAMLLAAPDTRLTPQPATAAASAEAAGNTAAAIAQAPTARLKGELSATEKLAEGSKMTPATIAATSKSLAENGGFALSASREEALASATPSAPPAHPGAQIGALAAAGMQVGLLQPAAATPATLASAQIAAPLNSAVWPDEFAQQVSWVGNQQNQSAELLLNPPDLGPIRVVLNVSDNQATALFSSPHLAVRDAIENALPKLREVMADNGIMLGNATVSDQAPRDSGGFMNQRPGSRADAMPSGSASPEPTVMTTPVTAARRHIGMVDTFA